VTVENVGFRDHWLPLYGDPLRVTGVAADRWAYDPASGTAYSAEARREDGWTQEALLPTPSADALRADGPPTVDPRFTDTTGIDPRVATLSADVTSGARTPFDRAVAVNTWFTGPGSAFTYDLSTAEGNGDDAMVEFLTRGRRGYCEQYASAMAAMLRTVGVPARVAVGFTAGREEGGTRTVATTDAHAWVEAWLPGTGWTTFDPTPLGDGRAVVPPYVTETAGTPDPAAAGTTAPPEPTTATTAPGPEPADAAAGPDAGTPPGPAPGGATARPDGATVSGVLLGLGAATALGALLAAPAVLRSRRRSRRLGAAAAGGPGAADAAWTELMAESTDRSVPGRPTETVREAAARLSDAHDLDDPARRALGSLVGSVEASAYGGVDPASGTLTAPLRIVLAAVAAGTPLRLRDRLLPASVTDELRRRPARPAALPAPAAGSRTRR
jgi:transglutaminase-like putative cysteine protease